MPWDVVELPLKLVHQVVAHRDPPGINYLEKTMPSGSYLQPVEPG